MNKIIGIIIAVVGAVITVSQVIVRIKGHISLSVAPVIDVVARRISLSAAGADGPTAVFVAGKIGGNSAVVGIVTGIVMMAAGVFIAVRKK
jgi:oxaloacetate decarboxylase beta subunit